jgi:hypothetical protein
MCDMLAKFPLCFFCVEGGSVILLGLFCVYFVFSCYICVCAL